VIPATARWSGFEVITEGKRSTTSITATTVRVKTAPTVIPYVYLEKDKWGRRNTPGPYPIRPFLPGRLGRSGRLGVTLL
jgi:hypothetical protein